MRMPPRQVRLLGTWRGILVVGLALLAVCFGSFLGFVQALSAIGPRRVDWEVAPPSWKRHRDEVVLVEASPRLFDFGPDRHRTEWEHDGGLVVLVEREHPVWPDAVHVYARGEELEVGVRMQYGPQLGWVPLTFRSSDGALVVEAGTAWWDSDDTRAPVSGTVVVDTDLALAGGWSRATYLRCRYWLTWHDHRTRTVYGAFEVLQGAEAAGAPSPTEPVDAAVSEAAWRVAKDAVRAAPGWDEGMELPAESIDTGPFVRRAARDPGRLVVLAWGDAPRGNGGDPLRRHPWVVELDEATLDVLRAELLD